MMIPFSPFEPDKSPFEAGASQHVVNAMPVANGWGPMPGLALISQALPGPCKGAVYVRDSLGNYAIIATTATRIYKLNTAGYTWEDISGPSAPYNLPVGDFWTFTRFGQLLLIHNLGTKIQAYDIDAGTAVTDLGGNPPKARYSWVAGDFVVLGYLEGMAGERTVRWCGLNNAAHWTVGKKGADYQELPEGDEVMGGFGEQGGFSVIQRFGMQFFPFALNSGFTFTRTVLNPKQGSISPRSIVSIGPGQFFYLSEDGFFGGVERRPIGAERVDRWFLDQIDQDYLAEVQAVADPYEKIIWWKYRARDGKFYRLGYDWQLDRWCTTDLQIGEMMAPLVTPAISWDGLSALYSSIDAVTEAFNSRIFSGGRPTFATFTTDNKLAYFAGPNLEAVIDTAALELDVNNRTFIRDARAVTDAKGFTLQDGTKAFHGEDTAFSAPVAPHPRTGLCHFRSDGRLHKLRLTINEGETWSIASGVNVNASVSGRQ